MSDLVTEERRAGRRAGETAGRGEGQFTLPSNLMVERESAFAWRG
jgi:hypothetical protein